MSECARPHEQSLENVAMKLYINCFGIDYFLYFLSKLYFEEACGFILFSHQNVLLPTSGLKIFFCCVLTAVFLGHFFVLLFFVFYIWMQMDIFNSVLL